MGWNWEISVKCFVGVWWHKVNVRISTEGIVLPLIQSLTYFIRFYVVTYYVHPLFQLKTNVNSVGPKAHNAKTAKHTWYALS